ncbi:MAG: hypothetical protein GXP53_01090 [Deltaproteobacteria bacterium]|nr:hypothetical protein [Deltaproteobacteria bacterium]
MFKWEYPGSGIIDDDMGYSYSRAYIVNTKAAGWVVIFGNGYDSVNGEAVLYVLDPTYGYPVATIHTGVFGCNGLSTPAVIDVDINGQIDLVYAGDLKGNMWKFDFSGPSVSDWKVAYDDNSVPMPLFTAKNANGDIQPITSSPDVMKHCEQGLGGYIVVFGTGEYLGTPDFADTTVQSLYGIWDWGEPWVNLNNDQDEDNDKYYGYFKIDRTLSNLDGNTNMTSAVQALTLLEQTIEYSTADYLVVSNNTIDYYNPTTDSGTNVGWYLDLTGFRERIIRDPIIRNGVALFVSSIPSSSPCSAGGQSVIYQINACSGSRTDTSQFDVDLDGKYDSSDMITLPNGDKAAPSGQKINKMLYDPIIIKDRMYINDATGSINNMPIPKILAGQFFWREIENNW